MSADLSLRLAQKYVGEYEGRFDEIMRRHSEAMECRQCEEFLAQGLNAFHWLRQAEDVFRQAAIANLCTGDEELEYLAKAMESLNSLFLGWLRPCDDAESRIAEMECKGFSVTHAREFREACEYVRRRVQKAAMCDAVEDAFQGRVFDEAFWNEAARMRAVR